MSHHLIVGAGPVGRRVAARLVTQGEDVRMATRSGRSTGLAGVSHLRLDAADRDALARAAEGASVLYNCANPGDYTQWERAWPPLADSLLFAAERSGAVYAITGNLYPYGPVDVPMREGMPDAATDHKGRLRARMWAEAKAAHDAGRVRALEVRASDYMGPGVGANGHISRVLPAARAGKPVTVLDRADRLHTFTDVRDTARLLVEAAADPAAHGRIWHVPSNVPRTPRQAIADVLAAAGLPPARIIVVPSWVFATTGVVWPLGREFHDLSYQRRRDYVLDDADARRHFGMEPTPWEEVCRATALE